MAFALRHPQMPGWFFAELRRLASHRTSVDAAELPADLRVKPFAVAYADLFFVDEYPALRRGLRRINRDFHSSLGLSDPSDWVGNAQARAHGTGTTVAGGIELRDDRHSCLARIDLVLAHVTASAIALIAYARPTIGFIEEFATLLHSPTMPDIRLKFPRHRFLGYTHFPAAKHRAEEVRELFNAANREVCLLFRSYFHAGLSLRGPLPSIEAFTVSRGRPQLSRVMTVEGPGENVDLLSVLGARPGGALYETASYVLYETSVRTGDYEFGNLQLLIPEHPSGGGHPASGPDIEIFYDTWHIGPLLALNRAYAHAINDVLEYRNHLSAAMRAFRVRRIGWHISRALRLGALQFRLRLLRSELGTTPDPPFPSDTKHIRRNEHWGSPPAAVGNDLWSALQDKQDLLERQSEVLRTTHQEVTALKSLAVGYSLQWIAIILAAAAIFGAEINNGLKAALTWLSTLLGS